MHHTFKSIQFLLVTILVVIILLPIINYGIEVWIGPFCNKAFELYAPFQTIIDFLLFSIVTYLIIHFSNIDSAYFDSTTITKFTYLTLIVGVCWFYFRVLTSDISPFRTKGIAYVDILFYLALAFNFLCVLKYTFYLVNTRNNRESLDSIKNDFPILTSNEDELQRNSIVKNLASHLITLDTKKGARSIALTAPWGNGKSSFLNLLKNELRTYPGIEIFEFVPWVLTPASSVTAHFFQELIKRFGSLNSTIGNKLKEYAQLLEAIDASWISNLFSSPDLISLTTAISESLAKFNKRIIIIFDDIDRLSACEIEEIFRIIRGSMSFTNFIFLSAFDKRYIQTSLTSSNPAINEHYIEKFFELEFPLPEIRDKMMIDIILKNVTWMKEGDYAKFKKYISADKTLHGDNRVFSPLTNLRMVYRWINCIKLKYRLLQSETRIEDLADLEMLNLLFPAAYSRLSLQYKRYVYRDKNTGWYKLWTQSNQVKKEDDFLGFLENKIMRDFKEDCKIVLAYTDDQMDTLNTILDRLLPHYSSISNRGMAFSNPHYTERYFHGALSSSELPTEDFNKIIEGGQTRIKHFIDNDTSQTYTHSLYLHCINFAHSSSTSENFSQNILFCAIYASIAYDSFGLLNLEMKSIISKLSGTDDEKKRIFKTLISSLPFSRNILFAFSPVSDEQYHIWDGFFSKEECEAIQSEMLTKAINEDYPFQEINTFYNATVYIEYLTGAQQEKIYHNNHVAYIIFKNYLAHHFISHIKYFISSDIHEDTKFFPSYRFTTFWRDWEEFEKYREENNIQKPSSKEDWEIYNEYQQFYDKWKQTYEPIPFEFQFI